MQDLLRTGKEPFTGDAHALLVWAYKNPDLSVELPLAAAKAVIGYEKPRLATTAVKEIATFDPALFTEEQLNISPEEAYRMMKDIIPPRPAPRG